MPSRYITCAIVVFWLAMAGWLFHRDFLPWLQVGAAPRLFRADFSDEVRSTRATWFIHRDGRKIGAPLVEDERSRVGSGEATIQRNDDRTYSMKTELKFRDPEHPDLSGLPIGLPKIIGAGLEIRIQSITSEYVVGPDGELRQLATEVTLNVNPLWKEIVFSVDGKVKDEILAPHLRVRGLGHTIKQQLDGVKVSARDSFVNPMHLLHRIPDKLYDGRSWPVPVVDPLGDAAMAFIARYVPLVKLLGPVAKMRIEKLFARVGSGTLTWGGTSESCWIIDFYRDPGEKEIFARTWVRKRDQWLLCQEAAFQGSRLVMVRLIRDASHQ
jgi:hypothetical protein